VRLRRRPVGPLYETHDLDRHPSAGSEVPPGGAGNTEPGTNRDPTIASAPGLLRGAAGLQVPWRIGALVQLLPACLVALAVGFILVRELASHLPFGGRERSSLVRSGGKKKDGDASPATIPRPRHPPGARGPQLADDLGARVAVAPDRFPRPMPPSRPVASSRPVPSSQPVPSSRPMLSVRPLPSARPVPSARPMLSPRSPTVQRPAGELGPGHSVGEARLVVARSAAGEPREGDQAETVAAGSRPSGDGEGVADELGFER
jgi:hypothetical protein